MRVRARLDRWVAATAFGGACLGTALVVSARWFWFGELAASFAFHLGWLCWLATAALLALGRPRRAAVAGLLGLLHAGPELALWLPVRTASATTPTAELVVLVCNLRFDNERREEALEWLAASDADVVFCAEVSRGWRRRLEGLAGRFPHQAWSPGTVAWWSGTWGTAVLSRRPLVGEQLVPVRGASLRPILEVEVAGAGAGERFLLRGAHPMRPGSRRKQELRAAVLGTLAGLDWPPGSLLVGDLNVTSTSPAFHRLVERSGLADSRRGFGRAPSWPTHLARLGLGVAIDHALVGPDLAVLERTTVELPGSDHLAVRLRIARTR